MLGIIGIVALLTVLGLSLVITRLATIALTMTGLSYEAARFQARSAFTGTGFTTNEAEKVVDHPVRRRIIMLLMIVRSAGLMTIIISMILSFVGTGTGTDRLIRLVWLTGGVLVLWILSNGRVTDRYLNRFVHWALRRWTDLDTRDYISLLKLSKDYTVTELEIQEGDWLAGKTLGNCRLTEEGVTVIGVYRNDGTYVGAPRGNTELYPGDTLIIYGRVDAVVDLDRRPADSSGERAHEEAVDEERRHLEEQDKQEQEHKQKIAAASMQA